LPDGIGGIDWTNGSMTPRKALTCSVSMIRLAVVASDPRKYLPLDKSDVINIRALLALGYPAMAPCLRELLEWLQDGN
jgi:hypothetical protein